MSANISTKLHEALNCRMHDPKQVQELEALKAMASHPHYVFEKNLHRQFDQGALVKSMVAIHQAGLLRLPFPVMFLELWSGNPDFRFFVELREQEGQGRFHLRVVEWVNDELWPEPMVVTMEWEDVVKVRPGEKVFGDTPPDWDPELNREPGWLIHHNAEKRTDILRHISIAVILAVMMAHINGLEREVVDVAKLNKHRRAKGNAPIPTHTVVKIGHLLDRDGKRVRYIKGDQADGGGRGGMPVHMRAAHTRRQQHGPRWVAFNPVEAAKPGNTATEHTVFIEAVLVNYRDGTDLEKPLPRFVTA